MVIRAIAAGGSGIGTLPDGRAVFVPRTAPGDRGMIRVIEEREIWAPGILDAVLEGGSGRTVPPCPLYNACGGCTLQHLTPDAQRLAKGEIVRSALQRIGGLTVPDFEVHPSPDGIHYRNRVSFSLVRHPGGRVRAGFHEIDRPGRIVDVGGECLLPEPAIGRVWVALREAWGTGADRLPSGDRLRLTLRAVDGGVVLVVEEGDTVANRTLGDPATLLEAVPGLRAVWDRAPGGDPVLLAGEGETRVDWGGISLPVGASAFLQVNRSAASRLEESLLSTLGDPAGLSIVDAYCGVGVLGRTLAGKGGRITGIELDPQAVAAAEGLTTLTPDRGGSWRILEGPVEERLAEALPADVVLLNPPRAGLDARIPALLRETRTPRILYASCDPATLARDLGRLGGDYRLVSVRPFDLFPMTAHVETLVELHWQAGESPVGSDPFTPSEP